ncbi:hypothetical protein P8C59_003041 [Phyllachora maydis]|uniref:Endonuclease III homolog n=1 Tax=Phyllachora maydis TaxID=1825666 RepID=A0AAD9M9X7_9PEZI|nr:hypothetical protein P8C59_003041 [Phyllachora maydis]
MPDKRRSVANAGIADIEDAIRSADATAPPRWRVTARKRKRTSITTSSIIMQDPSSGEPSPSVVQTETTTITTTIAPPTLPSPPRKRPPRSRARPSPDPRPGTTPSTAPAGWEAIYATVRAMRLSPGGAASCAPVDTMGCERLAGPAATTSARDRRFQTLVALMLSSQTRDAVNAAAMARLHGELPPAAPGAAPGLCLENVLAVDDAVLNELIGKVGFHNVKTKHIKQTAALLRDRHGGDIPDTVAGLTGLPGVGPKMAYLCVAAEAGWGRVEGIGVDVHVHRITNLWGWQRPATRTPEQTRRALEAWLPRDRWGEINALLVGLGQTVCLPVGRRCDDCDLGLGGLCPSAEKRKVVEGRRRRRREEEGRNKGEGDGLEVKREKGEQVVRDAVTHEVVKKEEGEPELDAKARIGCCDTVGYGGDCIFTDTFTAAVGTTPGKRSMQATGLLVDLPR